MEMEMEEGDGKGISIEIRALEIHFWDGLTLCP